MLRSLEFHSPGYKDLAFFFQALFSFSRSLCQLFILCSADQVFCGSQCSGLLPYAAFSRKMDAFSAQIESWYLFRNPALIFVNQVWSFVAL